MTLLLMSLLDDTLYTVPIFNDISCVVDDTFTDLFSNKIMVSVVKIAKHEIKTTVSERSLWTAARKVTILSQTGQSFASKWTVMGQSGQSKSVKVDGSEMLKWAVQKYQSGSSKNTNRSVLPPWTVHFRLELPK